jgi:hypothetical protein
MAGKRWTARRCFALKKDGGICHGRALENGRCKFHGGLSTPYDTRPIPPEGIERIREASRARMLAAWQAYREAKARGLPLPPRLGNKKRRTAFSEAPATTPAPPVDRRKLSDAEWLAAIGVVK